MGDIIGLRLGRVRLKRLIGLLRKSLYDCVDIPNIGNLVKKMRAY